MADPTPAPTEPPAPVDTAAPTPTPASAAPAAPTQLPDDHPLVKAFAANKTELADAKKRLQDIDDANKSDAQKAADRIATLEAENKTLTADKLRAEVAAEKGVPVALLAGTTKAELEASAAALIAFRGEQATPTPKPKATPPGQSPADRDKPLDAVAALRELRKQRD